MKNQVIPWFLLHGRDFGRGFQGDRRFPKSLGHSHHRLICVAWFPQSSLPPARTPESGGGGRSPNARPADASEDHFSMLGLRRCQSHF